MLPSKTCAIPGLERLGPETRERRLTEPRYQRNKTSVSQGATIADACPPMHRGGQSGTKTGINHGFRGNNNKSKRDADRYFMGFFGAAEEYYYQTMELVRSRFERAGIRGWIVEVLFMIDGLHIHDCHAKRHFIKPTSEIPLVFLFVIHEVRYDR